MVIFIVLQLVEICEFLFEISFMSYFEKSSQEKNSVFEEKKYK